MGNTWYSLEGCILNWKNIEKLKKIYLCNFNINTKYDHEWDNLQSKLKEYTKMHKIDGWENLIQDEIIVDASNPCKNSLFIIVNDVEIFWFSIWRPCINSK